MPWWAWAVLVLGVLMIFGDRKVWEFEVEFPHRDGVGKGEVEFEYYTNRKPILEVELDLEPPYLNKDLEVTRNGQRVILIPSTSNTRPKLRIHEPYRLEKPAAGDLIEIKCAGETLFRGELRAE
ncbi:MAG: hypothetical protein K8I00_11010 [Candidatus Omnitrophica bacterium]|nr:hypothetical protein [Candidatus Omnitrophota bacterium]